MSWFKRILIAALVLVLVAWLGFNIFKRSIATALFERVTKQRVVADPSADLPDGLHVYLCGTGSPMPDATRAGPCLGILAGDRAYVFDIGSGGARNLGSMGFPIDRLEAVYLTHLHSDHIDGLGEFLLLSWIGGRRAAPTPVFGPAGTTRVVSAFNDAYEIDSTYRVAHHGPEVANPGGFGGAPEEIVLPAGPAGQAVVFEEGDLTITAVRVEHAPVAPAFGYRIDYKDRSVSISGDTIYHPGFIAVSKDVDVMFHEALDPEMVATVGARMDEVGLTNNARIFEDILDYHASPEEAAQSAQEAGARELVLYHLVPPLPVKLVETVFLGDAKKAFDGPIMVGQDGVVMSLPAGSDRIQKTRAF